MNGNRSEHYSTGFIIDYAYILKVMSNLPNTIKRREMLQSKGRHQEKAYKQDSYGMCTELNKGAEPERERSTKRLGTGV